MSLNLCRDIFFNWQCVLLHSYIFLLVYSRIIVRLFHDYYVSYGGQEFCGTSLIIGTLSLTGTENIRMMIQHYLHSVESNMLLFWYMYVAFVFLRRQWSIIKTNLKNTIFLASPIIQNIFCWQKSTLRKLDYYLTHKLQLLLHNKIYTHCYDTISVNFRKETLTVNFTICVWCECIRIAI